MRNLHPNQKRETHPEKYFADDTRAYAAKFDVVTALVSHCANSIGNCVLGLLRVVELGFCPPLAHEARCIPVFSQIEILELAPFATGRRGKPFAYMLPELEKYRSHLSKLNMPPALEDELMHMVFRMMENRVDTAMKTDSVQLALDANAVSDSSEDWEGVQLDRGDLSEEFDRHAGGEKL